MSNHTLYLLKSEIITKRMNVYNITDFYCRGQNVK